MEEDIRRLVKLQTLRDEICELERQRQAGPQQIEALTEAFRARVEEIGSERLRHEALVRESRELEQERSDLLARLQVAQQKLMQVSNQREYSAVLNEQDLMKARLGDVEQSLAVRATEIEELAGPAAEADERIASEKTQFDSERAAMEKEIAGIDERLRGLAGSRAEIELEIPVDLLRRFDRIFEARGGIAVAPIVKTACGACHVKLRPQVISLCRRRAELTFCDSCRRILYTPDDDAPSADDDKPAAAAGHGADASGVPGRPAAGA